MARSDTQPKLTSPALAEPRARTPLQHGIHGGRAYDDSAFDAERDRRFVERWSSRGRRADPSLDHSNVRWQTSSLRWRSTRRLRAVRRLDGSRQIDDLLRQLEVHEVEFRLSVPSDLAPVRAPCLLRRQEDDVSADFDADDHLGLGGEANHREPLLDQAEHEALL